MRRVSSLRSSAHLVFTILLMNLITILTSFFIISTAPQLGILVDAQAASYNGTVIPSGWGEWPSVTTDRLGNIYLLDNYGIIFVMDPNGTEITHFQLQNATAVGYNNRVMASTNRYQNVLYVDSELNIYASSECPIYKYNRTGYFMKQYNCTRNPNSGYFTWALSYDTQGYLTTINNEYVTKFNSNGTQIFTDGAISYFRLASLTFPTIYSVAFDPVSSANVSIFCRYFYDDKWSFTWYLKSADGTKEYYGTELFTFSIDEYCTGTYDFRGQVLYVTCLNGRVTAYSTSGRLLQTFSPDDSTVQFTTTAFNNGNLYLLDQFNSRLFLYTTLNQTATFDREIHSKYLERALSISITGDSLSNLYVTNLRRFWTQSPLNNFTLVTVYIINKIQDSGIVLGKYYTLDNATYVAAHRTNNETIYVVSRNGLLIMNFSTSGVISQPRLLQIPNLVAVTIDYSNTVYAYSFLAGKQQGTDNSTITKIINNGIYSSITGLINSLSGAPVLVSFSNEGTPYIYMNTIYDKFFKINMSDFGIMQSSNFHGLMNNCGDYSNIFIDPYGYYYFVSVCAIKVFSPSFLQVANLYYLTNGDHWVNASSALYTSGLHVSSDLSIYVGSQDARLFKFDRVYQPIIPSSSSSSTGAHVSSSTSSFNRSSSSSSSSSFNRTSSSSSSSSSFNRSSSSSSSTGRSSSSSISGNRSSSSSTGSFSSSSSLSSTIISSSSSFIPSLSSSSSSSSSNHTADPHDSLSSTDVAIIVVSVFVALVLFGLVGIYLYRRRTSQNTSGEPSGAYKLMELGDYE